MPEGHTIADVSAVSSISSVRRTNASRNQGAQDCETTRVDDSLRQERLEQLGMSSSGSKRPSTRPRDGDIREQRPDAALDVLSTVLHKHGWGTERLQNNNDKLHQTCGPVNQQRHVCVERCPLTTRHTAKRSGDNCGERVLITLESCDDSHRASAGLQPGGRSGTHKGRSQPNPE